MQTPSGETSFCDCKPKFIWSDLQKKCEIDCSQTGSLSDKERLSVNMCGCLEGSYWNPKALDCMRNCSHYDYSTGANFNVEDCICEDGYYWNKENPNKPHCHVSCGLRAGELTAFNETYGYCDCNLDTHYFSYQLQVCAINCGKKFNTRQSLYPSTDSCECILGYSWDATASATG